MTTSDHLRMQALMRRQWVMKKRLAEHSALTAQEAQTHPVGRTIMAFIQQGEPAFEEPPAQKH